MGQKALKMSKEITKKVEMDYLLYLPENYMTDDKILWPLVIFLHGAGERGDDIEKIKVHALPKLISKGEEFPFIVLSPQCPAEENWGTKIDELTALIREIISNYNVDTDRICLTGLSMGGYGTWLLAQMYPHAFAAIAPICGGQSQKYPLENIMHMPIWVFHGAKDSVVPLSQSADPVNKLNDIGANVKFTVYPELDHNSWTPTYENPALYKWMMSFVNSNFKF